MTACLSTHSLQIHIYNSRIRLRWQASTLSVQPALHLSNVTTIIPSLNSSKNVSAPSISSQRQDTSFQRPDLLGHRLKRTFSDECIYACQSGSSSYINMLYLNDGHIASLNRYGHLHHHNCSDRCPLLKLTARLREQRARRRKCCTLSSNLITDVRPESWLLTNTTSKAELQGAACAC